MGRPGKSTRWKTQIGTFTLAAVLTYGSQTHLIRAQTDMDDGATQTSAPPKIAISSNEHHHVHALSLSQEDLDRILTTLDDDQEFIQLQSSSGYDQGIFNGPSHTHSVNLSKAQLQKLKSDGSLTIESLFNFGHRHNFRILIENQCPGIAEPVPLASPANPPITTSPPARPLPSRTPSTAPLPSPSASPSVIPQPSPSPTGSVSPAPLPSASPSPGGSPSPIQ